MLTKSQLAVVDFNEGISLEQATTERGDKRFNVTFFKVTKQWSAEPIKEKKDLGYLHRMVKKTIKSAAKNENFNDLVIPKLPKNIAGVPKPDWKVNFHFLIVYIFYIYLKVVRKKMIIQKL